MAIIRFKPHNCVFCGKVHEDMILDADRFNRWFYGNECIQVVFPDLDENTRELMISGTCPECWEKYVVEEDEDVEFEANEPQTKVISEKEEMNRIDRCDAAIEIERLRMRKQEEENELREMAFDIEKIEECEEEERQKDLEEYLSFIDEQNAWFCFDPLNPCEATVGNIFS